MKNLFALAILAVLIFPSLSFDKKGTMENQPMPALASKSLDGKTIDQNYFRGHVTLVNFMFIGCMGCMNEISALNRLHDEYAGKPEMQVLCVARQMRGQMEEFNGENSSVFCKVRKALHVDPMPYTILPGCPDAASKMETVDSNVTLKRECNTLDEVYGLNTYPTTFFVDKKGIIRRISTGGPIRQNDSTFYNELKRQADLLLAE